MDPIEEFVGRVLVEIGEKPEREGLARTPKRVAEALRFLTSGYRRGVEEVLNGAVFSQEVDEIVLVKDIEIYSLCEHHLLPFTGKAHVAYLPQGRVIGLSKIPRIVDLFARRLQIQERLTMEIAKAIEEAVAPRGVGVVVEAAHLCMMMRGVEKQHALAVTSCMLGRFRSDPKTRAEFLTLVYGRSANAPLV
ncbi:MAG TPA: GTP cyclohydrolase I FolE [Planctomycetota bacterium]|nr:GTP cyclohydrolase I FolE [Planctomycetota bacterium]